MSGITPILSDLPPPPPGRTGWPWTETTPAEPDGEHRARPRITIITPSFNQAAFIEETIRSVLLQGYPNLEYIVVDGGSSDGTVDILKKYSPWIFHWVSEPDCGQSDAINKGLARATGEWVNWLNSDDFLMPGALIRLVAAAGPGEVRLVAGTTANIRDGRTFGRYSASVEPPPRTLFTLGVNQPGSLLRLKDVRAADGVRTDLGLCMDLDLWQRILGAHGTGCLRTVPDEVAAYRYHSESKTCREPDPFALEEYALLFDLAISLGADLPESFATLRASARFTAHPPAVTSFKPSPAEAETAFLERLLVSDNLLFRALLKQDASPTTLRRRFLLLLESAGPTWTRRFQNHSFSRRRSIALVEAAQSLPRFQAGFFWSALRLHPSPRILADALRKLLKP